ncbi:MAG TPA: hypothetical protein VFQ54_01660 [Thermomicrobiales bacterium]|nr:hypothetical protein [Thermomicrobiales bacterium]
MKEIRSARDEISRYGRRIVTILAIVAIAILPQLTAAQSDGNDPDATPPVNPSAGDATKPCFNGLLRVRDLEQADATLVAGMADAEKKAKASFQPDVRLYSLRLGCPLLASGLQWNGTYFSETAQAYYSTDTGEVQAAEDLPNTIPTLDITKLSFRDVYRSLLRAGFGGDLMITASGGVTVKESTDTQPFGPPNAPKNVVYVHLAIEDRNEVKDIWVDATNGTVYRYEL